jgi:L-fuconolactonase
MKIDSHQHFWHYDPAEHVWMTDAMAELKRDLLPEDLTPFLERTGYDGTIAVQARQNVEETEWLLWLAGRHDFIKGVVGWVDLRSPAVRDELEKYAANALLKGVRHVVHDEPDDRFMVHPEFLRGLGLLAGFDLAYDLLLFPRHLSVAVEVVERFPEQKFVLDHIGKPDIRGRMFTPWDWDLKRLSAFPNLFCKLSGMVTEAAWNAWRHEDFVPVLDRVFDCFGPDRLMIGSDWPVCTLSGDYEAVMHLVEKYLEQYVTDVRDKVLGGNAAAFYRIEEVGTA